MGAQGLGFNGWIRGVGLRFRVKADSVDWFWRVYTVIQGLYMHLGAVCGTCRVGGLCFWIKRLGSRVGGSKFSVEAARRRF